MLYLKDKDTQIHIRVSDDLKRKIKDSAKSQNMSVSDYVRSLLLAHYGLIKRGESKYNDKTTTCNY